MKNQREIILPSCSPDDNLAKKVSDFFMKIRYTTDVNNSSIRENVAVNANVVFEERRLTHLRQSTHDEVRDVIMKSPSESCDLDPLSTYLLKQMPEHMFPLISVVITASLVESRVSTVFEKGQC